MRFRHIRILLVGVLAAVFAGAQNRANFPWWNSPVVGDLGLNAAQSKKIRQIVRSYRDRLLDARNSVQKAEGALEDLINEPEVNPEAAKSVIDRVSAARANSSRAFLEMSVQLRAVLTLDQWRVLVRHWDEVQRKRATETQVPPE
jgi:Spy/CpxP family protein refolding chaperone